MSTRPSFPSNADEGPGSLQSVGGKSISVPFTVRARLSAGYAHGTPWGVSLDGLLASEVWESKKAAARAAEADWVAYDVRSEPDEIELPLDRCGVEGCWHWAATFAWPDGAVPGPHVQMWTGRADQQALAQIADNLPLHVDPRKGRYRSWVMPLPLTVAHTLVWRGVGDPGAVGEMLSSVVSIGKKRTSGQGLVLDWAVEPDRRADRWEFSHLHPDGTLGRTVPAECMKGRRSIRDGGVGRMGIRPPYMHPRMRAEVVLPAS
ncbi:hypothetical protein [Rhodococcus qingshengii]|uniref:hypothetical protein n=1 Tax=Rhodococcus qingshengii TaxID=334542 RepID=UPI001F148228|nr:hypothetical protein [Rhodococcus qingshengii]ULD38838.1 hypothetical protein JKI97_00620 [Rhodococcus qingshengii]